MTVRTFKRQTILEAMRKAVRMQPAELTTATPLESHCFDWLTKAKERFMVYLARLEEKQLEKDLRRAAAKKALSVDGPDPGADAAIDQIEAWFKKRDVPPAAA